MQIGVLALQGNFREHLLAFENMGIKAREVRLPTELEGLDGLVIPGGESTTIGRLAREFELESAIRRLCQSGSLALWGTCAGAIWMAREIEARPTQEKLGLLDISIARNAYGRQRDSFACPLEVDGFLSSFPAVFIRAPSILKIGDNVKVLAKLRGQPVLVREGSLLASTFHPEISGDSRIHEYFVNQVVSHRASSRKTHNEDCVKGLATRSH